MTVRYSTTLEFKKKKNSAMKTVFGGKRVVSMVKVRVAFEMS